ncbi:MAG: hypothetical protein ACKO6N_06530 [Myxococcota bacterium]
MFAYHYRKEEIEDMEARAALMARRIEARWTGLHGAPTEEVAVSQDDLAPGAAES